MSETKLELLLSDFIVSHINLACEPCDLLLVSGLLLLKLVAHLGEQLLRGLAGGFLRGDVTTLYLLLFAFLQQI